MLLDHQYTERGLRWSHLKGDDAARVEVLRRAAERSGCEVALAQAEIQETRECYEDDRPHWHRRGWSGWADDELDEGNESGPTVGEILDSTLEIGPAVGEALRFDRAVSYAELAEVTPTAELVPYDSEYTGYMGNWGNTMDRWYRRAAIVIWPLARAFAIRAKGDPLGALDDLLARTATDEPSRSARVGDAAALLRFWPDAVRRDDQHQLLPGVLRLAWELDDEGFATRLVEPFALEAISPTDATALVALAEQHGLEWFEDRLSAWLEHRRASLASPRPTPTRTAWVERLPEFCANLCDAHQAPRGLGTDIARSLLLRIGEWLIGAVRQAALITAPSQRETALAELALPTLAVLRATGATGVIGDPLLGDRIIAALCDPALRTTPMLVDVLQACAALPPDEREKVGAGAIAQHCHQAVEAALAQPQRAPDDWSITEFQPGNCCDDCTTLAVFLTDPAAQQTTWPLAKPRRQHIHRRIDDAELGVTHRTTRQGSPHKLVLTKTADLHLRDTERRRADTASLDIVQQFLNTV